ncbi:hypothetical protein KL905_004248 [Ogataea polymorpha]|uniref:Telomere length regulation protein conserved domain-containing protein n=1 Tax=Ogataea polymorpha TaxID=460523 RepID=A0A9P8SYV2_9ASCO|nr:hypothetical protein KL906_003917 [Ogataea polymorpha]KAG7915280.1 hypothetical protein KL927_004269 [Ogataea polymorpha]KAG7918169.1 hypothetical protein KL905_004248 [Ogataea polymorpha]KAG7932486.1 hypothetical protein KL934_003929 [Ogataea polymorpha]KAH3659434.1 hypothetical protein OGATHE_006318 [Ogataea polymorpha]
MELKVYLEQLKKGPANILELLGYLGAYQKDAERLQIASTLINHTLSVYKLADEEVRWVICDLLCCRVGLGQLVLQCKRKLDENVAQVLADTVSAPRFKQILTNVQHSELSELRSLLTVRVYEELNRAAIEIRSDELREAADKYPQCLLSLALSSSVADWRFVNGCLRMHSVDPFEKTVYARLVANFNEKNDMVFLKQLLGLIESAIHDSNVAGYNKLIAELDIHDGPTAVSFVVNSPLELQKIVVGCLQVDEPLVHRFISLFSLKSYIQQTSFGEHERLTRLLLLLLLRLNDAQIKEISTQGEFLDAISNHLESNSPKVRFFGMVVGDLIYERMNKKPMFDIEEHNRERENFMSKITKRIPDCTLEEAFSIIRSKEQTIERQYTETKILKPAPVVIDSDPEDSDDETVPRKRTVPTPVYLKEVVSYLQADSQKDQLAYEKHEILYKVLAPLVRTKANSQELHFYSEALLDLVLGLPNSYKLADFESWRLSCCIAICVGDFEQATAFLIKSFFSGDISLNRRVLILSCLSLSAREKAGLNDEFVAGKEKVPGLGPQRLPENIHKQFIQYEEQQKPELKSITEQMDTLKLTGTVTRISSRLTKKKPTKTKDTRFINNELPKMYFLLVSTWQYVNSKTGSGFVIGHYSSILNSHFLRTLALILDCAIPSSIQVLDMVRELVLILAEHMKQLVVQYEEIVLEAVLAGLRTAVQCDHSLLRQLVGPELIAMRDYLEILLANGVLDETTIQNCSHIVSEINRIASPLA